MKASLEATLASADDVARDPSGAQVFEILVREHADMLTAYLRCLVASDLVDDLFQEAMLTAWRRLGDYDRERPFGPWLRGIAARLVLRQRERRARDVLRCDSEVLDALDARFDELADEPAEFRDSVDRLLACVRRLPAKLRDAIELVYLQGQRIRQAAARLAASEEAIKKRVQRARRLLAECLRTGEVTT